MSIKLTVNGQSKTVDVPADTPLLWVLRDVLNMKGTKFGCGVGLVRRLHGPRERQGGSLLPDTGVGRGEGTQITTIEGLSADGTHPVQQAWMEIDVPQCGYCQAGQMMSASALLAKNSKPTDKDIDSAMNGNLCRCGTYLRIRQAVHRAAAIAASSKSQRRRRRQGRTTVAAAR